MILQYINNIAHWAKSQGLGLDLLCWIEITDQGAEFWVVRVREVVARLNCYQIGKGGFIFNIVRLEQGGKKACLSMVDKLTTVQ